MASVAPAPDEISLGEAATVISPPRCQTVVIPFESPGQLLIPSSEDSAVPSRLKKPGREESESQFIEDVYVRRWCIFGRTFAHKATDTVSHMMESKFGRQRYMHFRGSFQRVGVIMALGVWVPAFYAAYEGYIERFALLAGFVSPAYLVYALIVAFRTSFENTHGTNLEIIITVSLILQMIAINFSEYGRPRLDYGMLVMHLSFIYNFTPLSITIMNFISFVFGLGMFCFLKYERYLNPSDAEDSTKEQTSDNKLCVHTKGEADVVIGMLVPFVLLCFQTFITMRRMSSMRKDLLNQEQMKAQQKQLNHERKSSEDMLRSMLPRKIIACLKKNEPVDPQFFESVTVIFIEICHFGDLCSELEPELVVEILNIVYLEFDRLSDLLRVYKVETVGQVYMAVVGCPEPIVNHADVAAHFALSCQRSMEGLRERIRRIRVKADQTPRSGLHRGVSDSSMIQIRAGLNTGRLRAGVVGLDSPRYKLVGDTVNTASRMESTCEPSRVQVSRSTLDLLCKGMFIVEDRGEIEVKGKGKMATSFLNGYTNPAFKDKLEVVIERGDPAKSADNWDLKDSIVPVNGRRIEKSLTNTSMISPGLCDDDSELGGPAVAKETSSVKKQESLGLTAALPALNAALKRDWFSAHVVEEDLDTSDPAFKSQKPHWYTSEAIVKSGQRRFVQLHRMFLFVSPAYKVPSFLDKLAEDKPVFEKAMLQDRISFARNLTLVWLLMLSVVSAVDYYLDIVDDDVDRYRSALIARVVGNQVIGILYLLFLASPELFQLYAQSISIMMLVAQGASLLATATLVYNNESSIIALFGVYAMSYTVCTIFQRLCITFLAAMAFAIVEIYRCDFESARNKGVSIFFLFTLFSFIACGIRLEEFMEHISHFEGRKIASRVDEIKINKALGNELLLSLLPSHVVPLVRDCVSPIAEHHKDVTIIFTDIKGFTQYSSQLSPSELMRFLNNMYSAFDEVILNWELYKVEIIGDAYFISSGCPKKPDDKRLPDEWAMRAVEVALTLLRTMPQVCDDPNVKMRVGLHTGSVVAGVVGKKGPRYHLFGPTVAYAEKMESHGEPSRVHISDDTHSLLKEGNHEYDFEERTVSIEGEGVQRTWFVNKSNSKAAQQVARGLIVQRRKSTGRGR